MLLLLVKNVVFPRELVVGLFLNLYQTQLTRLLHNDFIIALDHLLKLQMALLKSLHRAFEDGELGDDLLIQCLKIAVSSKTCQLFCHLLNALLFSLLLQFHEHGLKRG